MNINVFACSNFNIFNSYSDNSVKSNFEVMDERNFNDVVLMFFLKISID